MNALLEGYEGEPLHSEDEAALLPASKHA